LVTVVVVAVVAVVVVFSPRFVFSSMTAWSQDMSQLKIAVGAWWNPKRGGRNTQWLGTRV
jgi:ABC-type nickel/cobalt efflux system permease component RcnA